jgi:transposase-like protein
MAGKLASQVRGLSEAEFRAAYGTEEQCRAVVEKLRWPSGFVCPACGGCEGTQLSTRPKLQCRVCRHQASLTAGTIFHATKLPLSLWFLAIWLVATAKNGISSVELGRRLGIKQTNAWSLKQKIMQVMTTRESRKLLGGRVEMDDAYLGGHRPGKRGRGAAGKQPFVAAVSTSDDRRPRKMKLLPVKGFRKKAVKAMAKEHLAPDARVVSDGLGCWNGINEAGIEHTASITGSGKAAAQGSAFKWVNTSLGNIKAAITGTYRQISPGHAGRYLGSFAWRFNHRFQLTSLIPRFVHAATRTDPLPYRMLVAS